MTHPFIVLEGLDGVGKSTCAKLLASQCSGEYIATPMQPFHQICQEVDAIEDLNTRFHFFLSAIIGVSAIIERLLASKIVICDRYVYATFAYHRAMGVSTEHIDFLRLPILKPSHVFLLTATEEIRHKRLIERGLSSWDKKFLNPALVLRLKDEFDRFEMTIVDTASSLPAEVVRTLLSHMWPSRTAIE